jgi:hypothetical protein
MLLHPNTKMAKIEGQRHMYGLVSDSRGSHRLTPGMQKMMELCGSRLV